MQGGQVATRGFLVQALSGLLSAFHDPVWAKWGGEWTSVEFEPSDADESVDIRWRLADGFVVDQVKSTSGGFTLARVDQLLAELVSGTPDATLHRLQLLGSAHPDVADLAAITDSSIPLTTAKAKAVLERLSPAVRERIHAIRVSQPTTANLGFLVEYAAGRLEAFLESIGEDVPRREWRLRIVDGLCARVLTLSTSGSPMSRSELEQALKGWVRGIRDEMKLHVVPDRVLIPVLTFLRTAQGQTLLFLGIRADGARSCYRVSGSWRMQGRHVPWTATSFTRNLTERRFGGLRLIDAIDPGVTHDTDQVAYHPADIGQRVEVEVGAEDCPRRLFFWESHGAKGQLPKTAPGEPASRVFDMVPFDLVSPIRPFLYGEWAHIFGMQSGTTMDFNGGDEPEIEYRFHPPEKFRRL